MPNFWPPQFAMHILSWSWGLEPQLHMHSQANFDFFVVEYFKIESSRSLGGFFACHLVASKHVD